MNKIKRKLRIFLAKAGLDGHDRGAHIIKNFFIEDGHEVFYFGVHSELENIISIAFEEGVDAMGFSILNGIYLEFAERLQKRLNELIPNNEQNLSLPIIMGGIIAQDDVEKLLSLGVLRVYTPGASKKIIIDSLGDDVKLRDTADSNWPYAVFNNKKGDKNFISWFISQIVDKRIDFREEFFKNPPREGFLTLGVTGPLGVGKSTLIDKLIAEFRKREKRVGVVSIDPSDPISGGAFLGRDRTQMWQHLGNDSVHIYSMATRGYQGGIAEATPKVIKIMQAADYDVVIVETIGVGQDQVAVKSIVDKTILVLTPDIGDDQVQKSGIMQIADFYVINKADITEAGRLMGAINRMLDNMGLILRPPIFETIANKENNNGVEKLVEAVLGV